MMRISLIIPLSSDSTIDSADIQTYKAALQRHAGPTPVELVLAGAVASSPAEVGGSPTVLAATVSDGRVNSLRAGLEAATGDYLVVMDPERRYPPEAVGQLFRGLCSADADLGIGVPGPSPPRPVSSR